MVQIKKIAIEHQKVQRKTKCSHARASYIKLLVFLVSLLITGCNYTQSSVIGEPYDNTKISDVDPISHLFISNDQKVHYSTANGSIYQYDAITEKSYKRAKAKTGNFLESNDNIYYSTGEGIYMSPFYGGDMKKLVEGKNCFPDMISNDYMIYHKAYKDKNGGLSLPR